MCVPVLRRDKQEADHAAALPRAKGSCLSLLKDTGKATQCYPMPTSERTLVSPGALLRGSGGY